MQPHTTTITGSEGPHGPRSFFFLPARLTRPRSLPLRHAPRVTLTHAHATFVRVGSIKGGTPHCSTSTAAEREREWKKDHKIDERVQPIPSRSYDDAS